MKSVYLKCRTNRSDGAKHPTQSESKIQPRACELLLGLLVNCLQIWQYISSLNSARRIPCPIMKCSFSKFEVGLVHSDPKLRIPFGNYFLGKTRHFLHFIWSGDVRNIYDSFLKKYFQVLYLVQLMQTSNTNPESHKKNFINFFVCSLLYKVKVFN